MFLMALYMVFNGAFLPTVINGLLMVINGELGILCACCAQQVLCVLSVLFLLKWKKAHFFGAVNHHVTKKMHFFFFQSVVFCPFLRLIYRGQMY